MIKAISPDQTFEYVCENDRESEQPTKWVLGVIDGRVRQYINDRAVVVVENGKPDEASGHTLRTGTWQRLIVKFGLRGWVNFLDADGKPMADSFDHLPIGSKSYAVVPDRVLDVMPFTVLSELATQLSKQNTLQEHDKRPFGSS